MFVLVFCVSTVKFVSLDNKAPKFGQLGPVINFLNPTFVSNYSNFYL